MLLSQYRMFFIIWSITVKDVERWYFVNKNLWNWATRLTCLFLTVVLECVFAWCVLYIVCPLKCVEFTLVYVYLCLLFTLCCCCCMQSFHWNMSDFLSWFNWQLIFTWFTCIVFIKLFCDLFAVNFSHIPFIYLWFVLLS